MPAPVDSQGTLFGLKPDSDDQNNESNRIQPLIGYEMNSEMLLCKFTSFFEHYGPPSGLIESDDLERCTKALLDANLLCQTDNGLQWQAYQQRPSTVSSHENKVFAPLEKIVDTIFKHAGSRRGNDYDCRSAPYRYLGTDIAGLNHKMEACIVEKGATTALSANNAIIPQEFTRYRNVTNQIGVRHKIVGDCQHIMSEDPRRMFIYGITIEDNRFSVWYFSRSHSTKAISFDWLCDERGIRKFIRVFLAFALASPEDVGVDPRVRKAHRENTDVTQQYIYIYPKTAEELGSSAPTETASDNKNTIGATADNVAVAVAANVSTHRHSTRLAAKAAAAEAERLKATKAEDERHAAAALEAPKFRYFKTINSIVPTDPYRISGRATRIWRVVEVKSADDEAPITGEVLILKDVWLDEGRPTEADNLDSIFGDIERVLESAKVQYPGDDWLNQFISEDKRFGSFDQPAKDRLRALLTDEEYKSLFLTKVVAWKGKVSKDISRKAAHTPKGIDIFAELDATDYSSIRTTTAMGSQSLARPRINPPTHTTPKLEVNTRLGRRYARTQQSRFVYKEVCTELKNVGTLGNLMDIINQALTALQVLFCAGWVHRDISIGNVLAFQVGDGKFKVKLSDLEFAEKLGFSKHRPNPRIGTPYFMPIEIMNRQYLLDLYRRPARPDLSLATDLGLEEGTPEHNCYKKFKRFNMINKFVPANATGDIPDKGCVPCYNYQHDLESLWWLVLYFISRGIKHYPSRRCAEVIFNGSLICSRERFVTLTESVSDWGDEQLHPKLVTGFLDSMESLRFDLQEGYVVLEVFGLLNRDDAYSRIHGTFARSFRELLERNEGSWKDLPLIDPSSLDYMKTESPLAGSKHALDDSESSDSGISPSHTNKRIKIDKSD